MEQTSIYNLNQWVEDDRILREDFNADNAKIEAALAAGVKIATGSYTGDGTYGSDHPNTLTFPFTPKVVFLFNCYETSGMRAPMMLIAPFTSQFFATNTSGGFPIHVTWGNTSVSWYCEQEARAQFNQIYGDNYYVALG